jgi:NAD(P)-dependent dehydrogenase (short-subunit alcohol dehydrogenase family)
MPSSVNFPPNLSFAGQSVLITGGSTGLGLETAIHYVTLGASPVIITARSEARGKEAVATIESRTGKKGIVQVRSLDMDSFSEVKRFVEGLENEVHAIDIVLLNAGCFAVDYKLSADGWEQDLQVNTLATALLAVLLLPWMRSVKQPGKVQHLGIVGSGNHIRVDIKASEFPKKDVLKHFNDQKYFKGGQPTYSLSKLLVHYAALEVAKLAIQPDGRYARVSPLTHDLRCACAPCLSGSS